MKAERWQQVEQLCEAALKHEAGGRAAFLKEVCGKVEPLQREVELLLAYEEQAAGFMETPHLGGELPRPRRRIKGCPCSADSWALLRFVAAGCRRYGRSLYRAKDSKSLDGRVATRRFCPRPSRREFQSSCTHFRREARMLAIPQPPDVSAAIYRL